MCVDNSPYATRTSSYVTDAPVRDVIINLRERVWPPAHVVVVVRRKQTPAKRYDGNTVVRSAIFRLPSWVFYFSVFWRTIFARKRPGVSFSRTRVTNFGQLRYIYIYKYDLKAYVITS